MSRVFPIASSSPKYFFAIPSVRIIELGSVSTVAGSPSRNLNENISKKFDAGMAADFVKLLSPLLSVIANDSGNGMM